MFGKYFLQQHSTEMSASNFIPASPATTQERQTDWRSYAQVVVDVPCRIPQKVIDAERRLKAQQVLCTCHVSTPDASTCEDVESWMNFDNPLGAPYKECSCKRPGSGCHRWYPKNSVFDRIYY